MNLALETGLVAAVLPPLVPMKGIFQGKPSSPRATSGTIRCSCSSSSPPIRASRWPSPRCLHDVGKPATKAIQNGRLTLPQPRAGRPADRRRPLPAASSSRTPSASGSTWLVEYHQYLGEAKRLREAKLKRILAQPGIEELLALHRADALASFGECHQIDYCEYYLRVQPAGPINPPPLVTGHDLVRHGLSPGTHFATILDQIREAQLDRVVNSKREALEWLDRRLADAANCRTESAQ